MGQVQTVLGPVDADKLGTTLMHEHVFVRSPEVAANWPTGWDTETRVADAIDRLRALKGRGVDTIVDLTVHGLGRDVALVRRVAEQVDLNIVVATGMYTYNEVPHYFDYRTSAFNATGVDALDEFFMSDFEKGIQGTDIRPGILKCATDEAGLTPGVERVLHAVARVHRATGIPISTHTHAHTRRGLEQQRVFTEEGVDLSRVVIGHSGDSTDIDYLEQLMRAGSTIGMDRFGVDVYCPMADRVDTVAQLCERGWASQMVLSHDAACHIDWFDPQLLQAVQPNWNFLHISDDVIPAMRERGVSDEQLNSMLVEAPRRILEHVTPY